MRKRWYTLQMTNVKEDKEDLDCSKRNSIHSVHFIASIGLLVALLILFAIVFAVENILPTPLTIQDEEKYPDSFIAERAQRHLKVLTSFGPRVVATHENENLTVSYLKEQISVIKNDAHPNQEIKLDVQVVTGSYLLGYKNVGAINAYSNVQNVIARISSKDSPYSMVINAHFDSVPSSPGGSDDGINCAVMLEILRKLSKLEERPKHNIIFLFNGAEETPLQAAHGFITKHPWAKEAKVIINLEAAGHGGKEVLFQTSPGKPWLLNYYTKVPYPFGQASGEEIFQSNIIPSDTDFRLFRDFGGLVGYDFAFARNGYRYHTEYDDFENIPLGSYQHVGSNILNLVKSISNAPELSEDSDDVQDAIVYYDFLGLFIISYTQTTAIILNIFTCVLSVIIFIFSLRDFGLGFSKRTFLFLGLTLVTTIVGWLLSVAFVLFVGFILDKVQYTMSWYRNPWILFGLYSAPTVAITTGLFILLNRYTEKINLCINVKTQVQLHVIRLIWTFVLFIGTVMKIRSVYPLFLLVIFQSLTFGIIHLLKWQRAIRKWQILYLLLGTVIPSIFLMYVSIMVITLFVPISGRMGSETNPEMLVGLITLFLTILITSAYIPLITLVRQSYIFICFVCGIFILAFILVFTPVAFAYTGNTTAPAPQRFWVYHTSRVFHDSNGQVIKKDSGILLKSWDRNAHYSIKNHVSYLNKSKPFEEDCENYLICGFPLASIKTVGMMKKEIWMPVSQPQFSQIPVDLKVVKQQINENLIRYNLNVTGADRQAIYISPMNNITIVNISLNDVVPKEPLTWKNDRPIFLIVHTYGKEPAPLLFTFDIKTPTNWNKPTADIAVVGHYSNFKINRMTPQFSEFLNQFPTWTDCTPWLGAYKSWVIT